MALRTKNLDWTLFSSASVILASMLTRKLIRSGYKKLKGKEPPNDPSSGHVTWREAIIWGIASGALTGLARITAKKGSAKGYKKVFKKKPPR